MAGCGDYASLATTHPEIPTVDLRGGFLLPGFIDTHIHFPQLRVLGGLGRSLLDWLEHCALPEEARMADHTLRLRVARGFVHALAAHGTTTALVFGAHFAPATAALFEAAEPAGLRIAAGLVLSDRRLLPELHQTPERAYRESRLLIERFHRRGRLTLRRHPALCAFHFRAMLEVCQTLLREHRGLLLQTHINENRAGDRGGQRAVSLGCRLSGGVRTIRTRRRGAVLAHNVHPTDSELDRLAASGAAVAHCPCSNAALGSGLFPLQRHIQAGVRCALGTDVGGGTGFRDAQRRIARYLLQRIAPDGVLLDAGHLLYLATLAGAEALGLARETGDFRREIAPILSIFARPPIAHSPPFSNGSKSGAGAGAIFTLAGAESVRRGARRRIDRLSCRHER